MELKSLFHGFWECGRVKIVLKSTLEKMKTWATEKAEEAGILGNTFLLWRRNNFKETNKFIIIDDTSLVENVPEIEVKYRGRNYLMQESEWKKIEPYFDRNFVFAKLLSSKSKLTKSGSQSLVPEKTIDFWLKKKAKPIITPDTDYESVYKRLGVTQDQETLMMSAGLGFLEGCGSLYKEGHTPKWRSNKDLVIMSNCNGLLPRPIDKADSLNWVDFDPLYYDFLEDKGFIDWGGIYGSFVMPKDIPTKFYGKNKNAFLAQAIQPALNIGGVHRHDSRLGFQLRTRVQKEWYQDLIVDLLKDMNALPSKVNLPEDKISKLERTLREGNVIIHEVSTVDGVGFIYAPQGLNHPYFDSDLNAVRLKNFFENILPYAFHFEKDYQNILNFESKMETYAENKNATEEQKMFRKSLERIEGVSFPHLEKKEFGYAGDKYSYRIPVWYK